MDYGDYPQSDYDDEQPPIDPPDPPAAFVPSEKPRGPRVNEALDDPHRFARRFIEEQQTHATGPKTLVYHRDEFLVYRGCGYKTIGEDELRALVHGFAKEEVDRLNAEAVAKWEAEGGDKKNRPTAIKISRGLITNVLDAIRSMTLLASAIEPPTWINEYGTGPRNLIAMQNGLLDVDAYLAGKTNCLLKASPEWFTLTGRPFDFDPSAKATTWAEVLAENLECDPQRIDLLQEWFGYVQVADTSHHRFMGLYGDGAGGKSTACGAIEASLGRENCSFVPLELFAERFQLTATLGKLANISAECSESDRTAEAILKQFVSADPMLFDRKNKSPLQCRPTARLMFAMNNKPRFNDRSSGLWRRMILMPFRVKVPEARRVRGMDSAAWWIESGRAEGLFLWALQGLARLRQRGGFTVSSVCEEAVTEYRLESNPAKQFLDEVCKVDPDAGTNCSTLYDAYKRWATANGYSPLSNGKFGGEVFRAFPKVRRAQNARKWCYQGLAFDQFAE